MVRSDAYSVSTDDERTDGPMKMMITALTLTCLDFVTTYFFLARSGFYLDIAERNQVTVRMIETGVWIPVRLILVVTLLGIIYVSLKRYKIRDNRYAAITYHSLKVILVVSILFMAAVVTWNAAQIIILERSIL